jgi:predicted DNA-binding transcriptional regulator AlpA
MYEIHPRAADGGRVEQTIVVAILRPRAAWEKLGVSRTTFYDEFVNKARVRLLSLGQRARGVPDDEIETLINQLRAERDEKSQGAEVRSPTGPA